MTRGAKPSYFKGLRIVGMMHLGIRPPASARFPDDLTPAKRDPGDRPRPNLDPLFFGKMVVTGRKPQPAIPHVRRVA